MIYLNSNTAYSNPDIGFTFNPFNLLMSSPEQGSKVTVMQAFVGMKGFQGNTIAQEQIENKLRK